MEEMESNGEVDRLRQEWGPIDSEVEGEHDDEDAARQARWDTDPPY